MLRSSCIRLLTTFVCLAIAALLAPGCSSAHPDAFAQIKTDIADLPADLWLDSKLLVSDHTNLALLALAGGGTGYFLCKEDDRIANHFEGHHTFSRDFTIAAGAIPYSEVMIAGAGYLYGVLADDEQTRQPAWATLEALALNGIYTGSLKLIANNHSPNGEGLAWPSGHTSTSVTFATVMNEFYGPYLGVPLYILSGFVMYERMETGEHWASDIVFGAAIGFTVGRTVAGRHSPKLFGMEIVPYFDPQRPASGIALAKLF